MLLGVAQERTADSSWGGLLRLNPRLKPIYYLSDTILSLIPLQGMV